MLHRPHVAPEAGIDLPVCGRKGLIMQAAPVFLRTPLRPAVAVVQWITWYETARLRRDRAGRISFRSDEVVLYRRGNSREHPDTDTQTMIDEVPR